MINDKYITFNNNDLYYKNKYVCEFNCEKFFDLKAHGISVDYIINEIETKIKETNEYKQEIRKEKLKKLKYE